MTPAQKRLARHALGLPNSTGRSMQNHFILRDGEASTVVEMLLRGHATVGRAFEYSLTRSGALAALEPGESLDPEDFPS